MCNIKTYPHCYSKSTGGGLWIALQYSMLVIKELWTLKKCNMLWANDDIDSVSLCDNKHVEKLFTFLIFVPQTNSNNMHNIAH